MNYISAKSPVTELKLDGVMIAFDTVNGGVRAVHFSDMKGNHFRIISGSEYSSLGLHIPAPPKTEKRFVVRGKLEGLGEVEKVFVHKHAAAALAARLQPLSVNDEDMLVTEEDVVVDQLGGAKADPADDMPF